MSERSQQQPDPSLHGENGAVAAGDDPGRTDLIGRDRDLRAVRDRLRPGRVLTITGVGGVGKTALARAIAASCVDDHDDVWVCELAAVSDAASLTSVIADAIGTFRNEEDSTLDAIASALAGRRALLVLDDVEQVASPAAGVVARLSSACPGLSVLATSRIGLGLDVEEQWTLDPLDLETAAPQLFVRTAGGAAPDVELADSMAVVTEICASVEGVPLAVELAAARLVNLTPTEVRDGLVARSREVRTDARPERPATLGVAIAWSHELLTPPERRLFERLSVFQGGFDEAGARAAFGADASLHDVADMLDSLVASSLLTRRTAGGLPRFEMLETLRQFGDRQLAVRGERASVRNAHLDHLVDRVASAGARCHGSDWRVGIAALGADWDNVRAATQWAIDTQRADDVDRLFRDLSFPCRWSLEAEPGSWARRAVERSSVTGARVGAPAHLHLAFEDFLSGRHEEALESNERALSLAVTPSDRSWARLYAAIEMLYLGRTDDAAAMADHMVADTPPRAVEQAMQGSAHPVFKMYAGQMSFEEAMDRVHRAEAVAEVTGSPVALGHVAYNRGLLLHARGSVEAAAASFQSVLEIGREHHVPNLVSYVLTSQVGTAGRIGLVAALDALSWWREHRDLGNEFIVLEGVGINLAELGQLEPAGVILGHLEEDGRRMASTQARRDAAMAELALQRRGGKWTEQGRSMSRPDTIAYARSAVERALTFL